jgi:hypothetical protein
MTVFVFTWNSAFLSIPADTEDESLGAGRIRDTKSAVGERLAVNHSLNGDANDGKHTFVTFQQWPNPTQTTAYTTPPPIDGAESNDTILFAGASGDAYNSTDLYFLNNFGQAVQITSGNLLAYTSPIPVGTSMCFFQASVPTGWTLNTAAQDYMVRLVSDGTGGQIGGSWAITGVTIGNTILTVNQIPAHDHSLTGHGGIPSVSGSGPYTLSTSAGNVSLITPQSVGGNAAHTHSFSNDSSWRPAYCNACLGVYTG